MAHSPLGFDVEKCRSLYVGNIATQVTEMLLFEIFNAIGEVENVKVIKDKNSGASLGYGFVDFYDHNVAQRALTQLNGRMIYGSEIRVNWAFAGHREDTVNHHHIFVGDLSPEIDDKALKDAFVAFGAIGDARVMWDQVTGRSRGYGFVAFRDKEVAEQAIREMNGVWLGTRQIRVNWANQKALQKNNISNMSSTKSELDYETVLSQASSMNTTVYIGGLAPETTENDLSQFFSDYGYIEEIRIQGDKGYAFVRYQTHESAAKAIVECNGMTIGNRVIKCSWGKERMMLPMQASPPQSYPYAAQQMPYPQSLPLQQPMHQFHPAAMPHMNQPLHQYPTMNTNHNGQNNNPYNFPYNMMPYNMMHMYNMPNPAGYPHPMTYAPPPGQGYAYTNAANSTNASNPSNVAQQQQQLHTTNY